MRVIGVVMLFVVLGVLAMLAWVPVFLPTDSPSSQYTTERTIRVPMGKRDTLSEYVTICVELKNGDVLHVEGTHYVWGEFFTVKNGRTGALSYNIAANEVRSAWREP
jgi:hypothetical protein